MAYVVTIIEMESGAIHQSSSYIVETEKEMSCYTGENPLPTVTRRNTSWVTYPTLWTFCVHVITKIS